MPGLDETKQFVPLKIAVLTISDSRSLKDDKSGPCWCRHRRRRALRCRAQHRHRRHQIYPKPCQSLGRRPRDRRGHHHRRYRLHRPRRHARGGRAAVRKEDGRLFGAVPGGASPRSAPLQFSRAPPRASPARPTSSACRAHRAPARPLGTIFGAPARLSLRTVQLRRDYAAAR